MNRDVATDIAKLKIVLYSNRKVVFYFSHKQP